MNLLEHANRELDRVETLDEVSMSVRNMLQGLDFLSGESVRAIALKQFNLLAAGEPLSPLTGADDEWEYVDLIGMQVNKRCARVVKDSSGSAYDMRGTAFRQPDGTVTLKTPASFTPVTFPYTPKTEIVDALAAAPNPLDQQLVFATASHEGSSVPIVLVGIPRACFDQLVSGKTNTLDLTKLGIGGQMVLFAGETSESVKAAMVKMVTPQPKPEEPVAVELPPLPEGPTGPLVKPSNGKSVIRKVVPIKPKRKR